MNQSESEREFETRKERLKTALLKRPGTTLLFGASDTGKTTLARELAVWLGTCGKTAFIDLDVGQSSVGPPGCLGACLVEKTLSAWNGAEALHFIGSFSPIGHFVQVLTGLLRLIRWADAKGAEHVLVDTTGFVSGPAAVELKYHKADICNPSHVVFLERNRELSPLRNTLRRRTGLKIHLLKTPESFGRTSTERRREYRLGILARYLEEGGSLTLPLAFSSFLNPSAWQEALHRDTLGLRLVGVMNGEGDTLAMGVIRRVDRERRQVVIQTPPGFEGKVAYMRLGKIRLQSGDVHIQKAVREDK